MEQKHNVEYTLFTEGLGNMKVTARMDQKELAKLLLQDNVTLLSVNSEKPAFRSRKAKRK